MGGHQIDILYLEFYGLSDPQILDKEDVALDHPSALLAAIADQVPPEAFELLEMAGELVVVEIVQIDLQILHLGLFFFGVEFADRPGLERLDRACRRHRFRPANLVTGGSVETGAALAGKAHAFAVDAHVACGSDDEAAAVLGKGDITAALALNVDLPGRLNVNGTVENAEGRLGAAHGEILPPGNIESHTLGACYFGVLGALQVQV